MDVFLNELLLRDVLGGLVWIGELGQIGGFLAPWCSINLIAMWKAPSCAS